MVSDDMSAVSLTRLDPDRTVNREVTTICAERFYDGSWLFEAERAHDGGLRFAGQPIRDISGKYEITGVWVPRRTTPITHIAGLVHEKGQDGFLV